MNHPAWCVVVEAHSDEDCHPTLESKLCMARVQRGSRTLMSCDKPAVGWRKLWSVYSSVGQRTVPVCELHLHIPGTVTVAR